MPFEFVPQSLPGVVVIRPQVFSDSRGFLLETYRKSAFVSAGIREEFVQDNHSHSKRGVLRGIHFQRPPCAQGKLVRVVEGTVWDVCVDLRRESPTFGRWCGLELSGTNHTMVYVPPRFGHGFVVVSDGAHFLYQCTAEYDPARESGVRWDDPVLDIEWPLRDVHVSDKDARLPLLADAPVFEGPSG